jgi:hypothetical protein
MERTVFADVQGVRSRIATPCKCIKSSPAGMACSCSVEQEKAKYIHTGSGNQKHLAVKASPPKVKQVLRHHRGVKVL